MGRQIVCNNINESKHQYVLSDVAAGVFGPSSGDLTIFVGDNGDDRRVEVVSALRNCANDFIDESCPQGQTANIRSYKIDIGANSEACIGEDAEAPIVTEDQIAISIGNFWIGSTPGRSQIFDGQIKRMIEAYIEDRKAV